MGNNISTNSVVGDRRSSKISLQRQSINFSKKMPYDIMVEKILLFEEQFTSLGKQNQNLKEKISDLAAELHSNPMF